MFPQEKQFYKINIAIINKFCIEIEFIMIIDKLKSGHICVI
jgi:hypothetical protein